MAFKTLASPTLTDMFVQEIERMIFSGELSPGEKLPPVKELAESMQVSQSVVNTGSAILAGKGLLTIKPRKGSYVSDYKQLGGLEALSSLIEYGQHNLSDEIMDSMYHFRYSNERTACYVAASHWSPEEMEEIKKYLSKFKSAKSIETKCMYQFNLFHAIIKASHNVIFVMLTNGFKELYLSVFRIALKQKNSAEYVTLIEKMVEAIENRDSIKARELVASVELWEYRYLSEKNSNYTFVPQ